MVTSHDKDIVNEFGNDVDRFHFKDAIIQGQLFFDYQIKSGFSAHSNAIELLNFLNFPKEIIENSR
jgi:DNA mismatch repair ATPase MutS